MTKDTNSEEQENVIRSIKSEASLMLIKSIFLHFVSVLAFAYAVIEDLPSIFVNVAGAFWCLVLFKTVEWILWALWALTGNETTINILKYFKKRDLFAILVQFAVMWTLLLGAYMPIIALWVSLIFIILKESANEQHD